MDELISLLQAIPVGGVGLAGLVTLVVVLIFKGELIPKATYLVMLAAKQDENNMLKEAYKMSEKARELGAADSKESLELSRTAVHLLEAIHERAYGAEDK